MKKPPWLYTAGWIGIGTAGLVLETAAIRNKKGGDTLTEHVRSVLEKYPVLRWTGIAFWAWCFKHLFIDK